MQTVDITIPNSSLLFQSMKPRPTPPHEVADALSNAKNCTCCSAEQARILSADGVYYTWTAEGDVFVTYPDGRKEIFWAKPTHSWAVHHREVNSRPAFFQFHPDGSVTCRAFGLTYFWSGEKGDAPPIEGTRIYGRYICDDTLDGWYFENDPEFYDDYDAYDTSYYSDCENMEEHRRRARSESSWSDY